MIDIGSNTANLLIVDAHHGAKPLPAASHKAALRLSEHLADDGSVRADGVADLVDFVRQARHLAEEQGAEELLGFATSAIRESANGPAVLQALNDASGLDIQVLSGVDEAQRTAAWQEIEEALAQFEGPDGFVGPCEMLVVSGTRP